MDLERVQKSAVRLIIGGNYEHYEEGLIKANLEPLKIRREMLCKNFAIKCTKSENPRVNDIFKTKKNEHRMKLRQNEKYEVKYAKTSRLKDSAIPYMQRILNKENLRCKIQVKRKKILQEDKKITKRRKPG